MKRTLIAAVIVGVLAAGQIVQANDYALQFNGVNQYVDCGLGDSLKLSNGITMEAWIWAGPIPNDVLWAIVSSQNDGTISGSGMYLDGRLNSDSMTNPRRHIHFQLGNGSWHSSNSTAIVPESQWVHIAVTRKAGEDGKFYFNGTLVPSISVGWSGGINFTSTWNIGRQQDLGTRYFKGMIDEVRIWNKGLTAAEILDTMCGQLTGGEPNLVGCWDMDEGSGTTTADLTANGNNGTLYNSVTWASSDRKSSAKPDAMVRNDDESGYIGDGIYDDEMAQAKSQSAGKEFAAIYDLRFENDGNALDRFVVTGPTGGAGWTVAYINMSGNSDITADVTGSGFESGVIMPGGSLEMRVMVTAGSGVANGAIQNVIVTAESMNNPAAIDEVKMTTTVDNSLRVPGPGFYTSDADFDKGTLTGLEHETAHNQLMVSPDAQTFPYIWVPNSNEGTVSKVDTRTSRELARYRTGPSSSGSPSRTTVDLLGNCWVANRVTGTAVKIGLLESGTFIDKNSNGIADTSWDKNGDGDITGDEVLAWGQDECVLYEVVVISGYEGVYRPGSYTGPYANDNWNPGPRGVAIDASNNLWLGTYNTKKFYYINSATGYIEKTIDVSSANHTSYGAVIDSNGILWSSGNDKNHVLRLDTSNDTFTTINLGHHVYGLGLDSFGNLFVSGWTSSKLSRVDINSGAVEWTKTAAYGTKGVAGTSNGDIWMAVAAGTTVTRWSNEGELKASISVGAEPTGVSVDNEGKVWVVNNGNEYIHRINPATNTVELSKRIIGGTHYGYSDMTGIVSRTITTKIGMWQVVHNSRSTGTQWGMIKWNASTPTGTSISAKVRSSQDRISWSAWENAINGTALAKTPNAQYLQIQVTMQILSGTTSPILYDLSVGYIPMGDLNRDAEVNFIDVAVMAQHWLELGMP